MISRSDKSYIVAVSLSGIFGYFGIQHFYFGRYIEGCIDILLTIGWIYYFAVGQPLIAIIYLGIDLIHTLITTVLLLTGSFKDGKGRTVCYPGQTTK